MPALNSRSVLDAVRSHAMRTGLFEQALGREPKSAPGNGLSVAVWAQRITPVPKASGLAVTSARLVVNVRIFTNMLSEPQDEIDPRVLDATDTLMAAYIGDFTLGGLNVEVDVLGAHGVMPDAQAGYVNQDGRLYRVMTITLPLTSYDVWPQVA